MHIHMSRVCAVYGLPASPATAIQKLREHERASLGPFDPLFTPLLYQRYRVHPSWHNTSLRDRLLCSARAHQLRLTAASPSQPLPPHAALSIRTAYVRYCSGAMHVCCSPCMCHPRSSSPSPVYHHPAALSRPLPVCHPARATVQVPPCMHHPACITLHCLAPLDSANGNEPS